MSKNLFEGLNEKQVEAVRATEGPVLVIAAAGSGKTKVLTHRTAHLIQQGVRPENILAVTFTNKAAGEMRERVISLIQNSKFPRSYANGGAGKIQNLGFPMLGTFHSISARLLRNEIGKFNSPYTSNFVIYDTEDQLGVIKKVMEELEIDTKKTNPRAVLARISEAKTNLAGPAEYSGSAKEFFEKIVAKIYPLYQKNLENSNAMDFDDLLFWTVKMLKQGKSILEKYQDRFRYILVDEYQDTNKPQYLFLKMLAQKHKNIMAVGDDYQCFPPKTKIKTEKGLKEIEKVSKGENILSPAGRSLTRPAKVLNARRFRYKGPLLEITTANGNVLQTTPNHILFSKLLPSKNFFLTYLMYSKKLGYRIGVTVGIRQIKKNKSRLGLNVRANQERADKMWILKLSPNRSEAHFWESYYAFNYGIPTTVFFADRGNGPDSGLITQKQIEKLFREIPSAERAKKLMLDLDLSFSYPHHRPQGTTKFQTKRTSVNLCYFSSSDGGTRAKSRRARVSINNQNKKIRKLLTDSGLKVRKGKANTWRIEKVFADNKKAEEFAGQIAELCGVEVTKHALITDINFDFMPASHLHSHMVVPVFNGKKFVNEKIIDIKKIDYNGPVYDLDIERTHTYTANNFAVHNSIYGFRQADLRNILSFERDYPEAKIVFLEQNYRSTQNILAAAQNIISNNKFQRHKNLWTENQEGEKILLAELGNEREEGKFITDEIKKGLKKGQDLNNFCVLYRTHAQSRAVEEAMLKAGLPYKIIGGLKFYERKEIKDVLAYLRLLLNPSDNFSLERIHNVPSRGIGKKTFERILEIQKQKSAGNVFELFKNHREELDKKALSGLASLSKTINALEEKLDESYLSKLIKKLLQNIDYQKYLQEKTVDHESRWENVKELLTVTSKYDNLKSRESLPVFLEEVSLIQETDQIKNQEKSATLMTMHASKGLEFPTVFLAGMEEGLFPHPRSITDPVELEEERRLCYVGITRAKEKLYLTHCQNRMVYGSSQFNPVSRFVSEIPEDFISENTKKPFRRDFNYEDFIDYD
ncbi:MAG: UvrD-helicase domain-containing protein [Candidatus Yanofskybacteria bacterium]|nr:UvrD-helicase domain-containing protein [Candidatus Yanofskybacteria bacterium]